VKIVLVAHARSGSNSLVEILQLHPAIDKIENEPFNERYVTWDPDHQDYVARLQSGESLDDVVAEVFAGADGLKLLSYQLDDTSFVSLTHRAGVKILTLRRRNWLQTAISHTVAMSTDLWQAWRATEPLENYYRDIGALELDSVRTFLDWTKREIERTQRLTADLDALHLRYEDLYTGAMKSRVRALAEMWEFLDLEPVDSPAIRHYLSPVVQQARPSTYGNITNLAEIETELGSDEWGHVAIGTE
jgi:hypothetical protein